MYTAAITSFKGYSDDVNKQISNVGALTARLEINEYFELSKGKTTSALKSLMKLAPKTATILKDGQEITVPLAKKVLSELFATQDIELTPEAIKKFVANYYGIKQNVVIFDINIIHYINCLFISSFCQLLMKFLPFFFI